MAMKIFNKIILALLILTTIFSGSTVITIPVTGISNPSSAATKPETNTSGTVILVKLNDKFAFNVVQQPKGNASFVSGKPDELTQFSLANQYGSMGFLAHNYLAGASFSDLEIGSFITVEYADSHSTLYQVQEIRHLQAINPNGLTTNFLDLDHDKTTLTTRQVFFQTYGVHDRLVLQTCISKDKELSWGRLFIIATPVEWYE